jgi:hypothetical protein
MPPLSNSVHERFAQAIAQGHCSQADAWLAAIGPERAAKVLARHKHPTALTSAASKLAAKSSIRARIDQLRAEAEQECRISRRELMDFYVAVIQQPAGTLRADSPLCQSVERVTTQVLNSKGEVTRTVTREKISLPSKCEAGEALRAMCAWDKKPEDSPEDDTISELLIMIRKRSSNGAPGTAKPVEIDSGGQSALGVAKPAEVTFPESTEESTEVLEALSRGHLEPLPIQAMP